MSHHLSFLERIAIKAMEERGFAPQFSDEIQQELNRPEPNPISSKQRVDLRHLPWSSIDNKESQDLDQIEYVEKQKDGTIKLLVGIAHVDGWVPRSSAIDEHALQNTTSIYTGVTTFPMIPEELSYHLTSLLEGEEKISIIVEMILSTEGHVLSSQIYAALIKNQAKFYYEDIARFLEKGTSEHPILAHPLWQEQIRLQEEVAQSLRTCRYERGALDLETIEARPMMENGQVVDLLVVRKNRAREVIEDFMIAANTEVTRFLAKRHFPSIRRIVRTPERWPRIVALAHSFGESLPKTADSKSLALFLQKQRLLDPERFQDLSLTIVKLLGKGEYISEHPGEEQHMEMGHFGLAVQDYTHSTAPNRRYPDLMTQRLIKAALFGHPCPYTKQELSELAAHCTERSNEAQKVERQIRKSAAAMLLRSRIGDVFSAIVTGASDKGTYVRLFHPPAEGRVVENEKGMDVGDKVKVKLLSTDPEQGFIDFAGV